MSGAYYCQNQQRKIDVGQGNELNGIDYVEVSDDQRMLTIYFLHHLPGQVGGVPSGIALTRDNFHIEGGSRIKDIRIVGPDEPASGNRQILHLSTFGDFSIYTLRLISSSVDSNPPEGFDPRLSEVQFSFKVNCPSEFDCKKSTACPEEMPAEPQIDYLAKDYSSFTRIMLDRLTTIMPDWKERNPADLGMALVELLAYGGDYLSYYQDAVATEAYLGTALKRISVRRHVRLLDYPMHDGCNARAWVCFTVNDAWNEKTLPGGNSDQTTRLLTKCTEEKNINEDRREELMALFSPEVFELMHDLTLYSAHNVISFYTWGNDACCLPKGATRATLRDNTLNPLLLRPGDVLILSENSVPSLEGDLEDADPGHRHAVRLTRVYPEAKLSGAGTTARRVRGQFLKDPLNDQPYVEVEWGAGDALPFPFCISAVVDGHYYEDLSQMYGNVALADHGFTIKNKGLSTSSVEGISYRPRLKRKNVTYSVPYDSQAAMKSPASNDLNQDPHKALPNVKLEKKGEIWLPVQDLLESDRFAREFVAETEADGYSYLRFGELLQGVQSEDPGFKATYRVGNGNSGNVGSEAIVHVVTGISGISASNPMPACCGLDPEPIEQAKLYAPQAFRVQERAVTEKDYAEVAQRHDDVQKAVATRRWTGSWYAIFVTVDRKGGREVDDAFKEEMLDFLDSFRMAGLDQEVDGPRYLPLDIVIKICVAPGYIQDNVKAALLETFGRSTFPDGKIGFFHPDNFTFGQPVYLSSIVVAAMDVPGVTWAEVIRFQVLGRPSNDALVSGQLDVGRLEVARLDNDPSQPENGKIEFKMIGGL